MRPFSSSADRRRIAPNHEETRSRDRHQRPADHRRRGRLSRVGGSACSGFDDGRWSWSWCIQQDVPGFGQCHLHSSRAVPRAGGARALRAERLTSSSKRGAAHPRRRPSPPPLLGAALRLLPGPTAGDRRARTRAAYLVPPLGVASRDTASAVAPWLEMRDRLWLVRRTASRHGVAVRCIPVLSGRGRVLHRL